MITLSMPDPATAPPAPRTGLPGVERSWQAVLARDATHDGAFVFAVRTTRIFCRPSCPARRPKRQNVEFFADPRAARLAGFRPCRRCRPESPPESTPDPIETARTLIEADPAAGVLVDLAKRVGLSPSHLQRRFKARYGLSPRELASATRARRLKTTLRAGGSVARATYDAGYNSSSLVYDSGGGPLGMTPAEYAKGGQGQAIRYAVVPSDLGDLLIAATDRGVCAVLLAAGKSGDGLVSALADEFPAANLERVDAGADTFLRALVDGIAAEIKGRASTGQAVPIDLIGTEFQIRVWKALLTIPRGTQRSYAEVARAIGRPRSVRAVANAVGSNRLAIVVPCHRVIRGDGSLGGYRWGLPLKRRLIEAERPPSSG